MSAADDTLRAAGLLTLGDDPSQEAVEAAVRRLGELAKDADEIRREALRAGAVPIIRKLGWRTSIIDSALAKPEAASASNGRQGQAVSLSDPEPAPDPVEGVALLNELRETFTRYLVLPDGAPEALALWTLHAYAHDASSISPLLAFCSATKRCGKTTALTLLGALVPRPLPTSNITPAALFRSIEAYRPTLLVDEADTFLGDRDDLRGVLNSGHNRTNAFVVRTSGEDFEPRMFSTWAPKVVAMIGELPDTLADRSLVVQLRRRRKDEKVTSIRGDRLRDDLEPLRRRCARWTADHKHALRISDPDMPEELHDRAADNWRPLLAIANAVGGSWCEQGRHAARLLSGWMDDDGDSGVLLLSDLRALFEEMAAERLASEDILEALTKMEERPWPEWRQGQPLTVRQLASLLKPYGVKPKLYRMGGEDRARGYAREDFEDAWARYLSGDTPSPKCDIRDKPSVARVFGTFDIRDTDPLVTDRKSGEKPCATRDVTDVTVPNPVLGNGTQVSSASSASSAPRPNVSASILASIHESWRQASSRS